MGETMGEKPISGMGSSFSVRGYLRVLAAATLLASAGCGDDGDVRVGAPTGGGGHSHAAIGSTEAGGGALATEYNFSNVSGLTHSACLGGNEHEHCEGGLAVYQGTSPAFRQLTQADIDEGSSLHILDQGTPLSFEITALEAAQDVSVSFLFGDATLDQVGETVHLGTTPDFHRGGTWQMVLPGGEENFQEHGSITFRFFSTAPEYSQSSEHTLLLMPARDEGHGHE
jgi:hypothetical protein